MKLRKSPRLIEKRDRQLKKEAHDNLWKPATKSPVQRCEKNKIRNPLTGRCIRKDGKVALLLRGK